MEQDHKAILKSLIAMMWADGKVDPEERKFLDVVVENLGLSEADRCEVSQMMLEAPGPEDLENTLPDPNERHALVKLLMKMALADGYLSFSEFSVLHPIATQLGLTAHDLNELQTELKGAPPPVPEEAT